MAARKQISVWAIVVSTFFLLCSFCSADEITFKNKGSKQTGTVVDEDGQNVTLIIPKDSVKSIKRNNEENVKSPPDRILMEDNGTYITVKIPRQKLEGASPVIQIGGEQTGQDSSVSEAKLKEKLERLEKKMESMEKTASVQPGTTASVKAPTHETLLQEEMGAVEGVIMWKGKPLQNARVMIVMESYTGFSVATLKKVFGVANEKSSGQEEIYLETTTDPQGRYSFPQVPPGLYTLFWQPDIETGWVRRIREKADFEIVPGRPIVVNIPEKKKSS
jgi:hypothetical protein